MKYYIPTSNLNLDNILQSECILPISHYAQRISGYKTFEQIDEVRPYKDIILFKNPVKFQINDTGRYNYPILIEFEDDLQTSDIKEIEGVCFCNHPLNLTPLNCRIYFFSKQEYNLTVINTKSNKAIKYYKDYKIYPTASMLHLMQMPFIKNVGNTDIATFEDSYIDKQKGVLYAYMLGQNKSVSQDIAVQLRLSQEIYNILTSLVANPTSISVFREKLSSLLKQYKSVDSTEKKNSKIFDDNLDDALGKRFKFLKGCFIDLLVKLGCWELVKETLCRKWGCCFLPDVSELRYENDFSKLRTEIENRTSTAVSSYRKTIAPNLEGLIIKGNSIEIKNTPLINIVINYIITNNLTPSSLLSQRMELYMNIMKSGVLDYLKDMVGEENWENSRERAYMNGLHAFIEDPGYPFRLNSIDNVELRSLAAFILRGHSFGDCMNFLKMNDFKDYRYVLTLWGCLCGYQEMNKDALTEVLSLDNYRKVYKMLFGKEMSEISVTSSIIEIEHTNKVLEGSDNDDVKRWQDERRQFAEYITKGNKNKKKLLKSFDEALIQYGDKTDDVGFITLLLNFDGWKTNRGSSKAWKKMQENFVPDYNHFISTEHSLFDNQSNEAQQESHIDASNVEEILPVGVKTNNRSIIQDDLAYKHIEECDFLGINASLIVSIFKEFQIKYRSGYYYKNQHKYKRNNNDVIDHFCKWCLSQKNKKALSWNPENRKKMDLLKKHLLNIYHD